MAVRFGGLASVTSSLILGLLCGCPEPASQSNEVEGRREPSLVDQLDPPSTFDGGLFGGVRSCDSCPGVDTILWLGPDRMYRRARTYLDADHDQERSEGDLGRWGVTLGGRVVLRSTEGEVTRFQIKSPTEIELLNAEGAPLNPDWEHKLERMDREDHIPIRVSVSGMYTYFADAAIFRPCNMRRTIPVAMTEQHVDLEHAYLQQQLRPASPLMVQLNARIEERPAMEGDRMMESLVVKDVLNLFPDSTCLSHTSLTDTAGWMLTELAGIAIHRADVTQLPVLTVEDSHALGSTGCNRFSGPVRTTGDSLRFGSLTLTKRACSDSLEPAFLRVLDLSDTYRIFGDQLELDSRGDEAAVFVHR